MKDVLLIIPTGELSEADRERLDLAGILAIEVTEPASVRVLSQSIAKVGADEIARAALEMLGKDSAVHYFGSRIRALAIASIPQPEPKVPGVSGGVTSNAK
jgi:hypothetical protein